MMLHIPDVLSSEEAAQLRDRLLAAQWVDGNETSGPGAAQAKRNRQLPETGAAARAGQEIVGKALMANATFLSAALPHTIFPPLFNRYGPGETFGAHVDNAIRYHAATGTRIRTDLSATLFLTPPDEYDGGELIVEGIERGGDQAQGEGGGARSYKLPAGSLLLYPSTTLHRVAEVTRGERVSCFLWLQSLVADNAAREMLFDLDTSVQALSADRGATDHQVLKLTQLYHNLVRRWAQS